MAEIIRAKDIFGSDVLSEIEKIKTELQGLSEIQEKIIKKSKDGKGIIPPNPQKGGLGELEKLKEIQDDLKKDSTQLVLAKKEEIRIEKQLIAQKAKLSEENIKAQGELKKLRNNLREKIRTDESESNSLDKKEQKLRELIRQYKSADATIAKKMIPRIQKLDKEVKELNSTIGRHQAKVGQYENALNGLRGGISKVIIGFAAFVGAVRAIGRQLTIIIDFEKQMSKVRAITGATKEEFKLLEKNALRLGSSTQFTATQVGELSEEFAKLGFNTKEIIELSRATLDLALVADTDLATAAKVAGGTVRGFGLETVEANRVIDVMAKSFSTTALDISKFETAMGQVAPVAKNAKVSIEETTAILGVLVDANIDASTAGTGLRNIYLDLADKGLTWDEALSKINNATDKNSAALDLFGKRGATVGTVIAENIEKIDSLSESFENATGTVGELADVMADNLYGDIKEAESAWEGLIISMNEGEGAISNTVRSIVSVFTEFLTSLTQVNQGLIGFWDLLTQKGIEKTRQIIKFQEEIGDRTTKFIKDQIKYTEQDIANGYTLDPSNIIHNNELRLKLLKSALEDREALEKLANEKKKEKEKKKKEKEKKEKEKEKKEEEKKERENQEKLYAEKLKAYNEYIKKLAKQTEDDEKERRKKIEESFKGQFLELDKLSTDFLETQKNIKVNTDEIYQSQEDQEQKRMFFAERRVRDEELYRDALSNTIGLLKENTIAYKILASAQAFIDTFKGANAVLADNTLPTLLRIVLASTVVAQGLANVAQINAVKFAKGVIDLDGPGNETSDSINAMLSKGESVMTAKETRQNKDLFLGIRNSNDKQLEKGVQKLIMEKNLSIGGVSPSVLHELKGLRGDYKKHEKLLKELRQPYYDKKGRLVTKIGNITQLQ